MEILLIFTILIVGLMIWSELDNISTELRYMNTLKEKEQFKK